MGPARFRCATLLRENRFVTLFYHRVSQLHQLFTSASKQITKKICIHSGTLCIAETEEELKNGVGNCFAGGLIDASIGGMRYPDKHKCRINCNEGLRQVKSEETAGARYKI